MSQNLCCTPSLFNTQSIIPDPICAPICPPNYSCPQGLINSGCVIYNGPTLSCLGIPSGSPLNTLITAMETLCLNTPSDACQVKVDVNDTCCDYLVNKISSSTLTISVINPSGCAKLNIENNVAERPTIYLNSNQNGTDSYSIPLPSPPLTTGDVVIDFDGRALYSHATNTPTFDFNIKGNRTVFVDDALFSKYSYDNNPNTAPYSLTPPKHYLGDNFNSENFEELLYETEIIYNCDSVATPAPSSNYETVVAYYLNGFGGIVVNGFPTSPTFKIDTKLTLRRVSNTTAIFIHELKLIPGFYFVASYGGYFLGSQTSAIEISIFGNVDIVTSLDVDALTYKLNAYTSVDVLDGLKYQVLNGKITLNKF